MTVEREALRDWHRLFGLLLTVFFTGLPFTVEVERDLSQQQQFLDVVIIRRGRGRITVHLPDGLDDLADHNLITFKSHHEALDAWAVKELIGHYVAYRKLVSPSPSELIPEDRFGLYAVCARFPEKLAGQVPWQERQAGVYDCNWAADAVRVIVAGQLSRQSHNAPLHLFSASAELIGFGQTAYRRHSEYTSSVLQLLFERLRGEGYAVTYTMEDFKRDVAKKYFDQLSREKRREFLQSLPRQEQRELLQSLPPEEQEEILRSLPAEKRRKLVKSLPAEEQEEILRSLPPEKRRELLESWPAEELRQYLDRLTAPPPGTPRKPRRKK